MSFENELKSIQVDIFGIHSNRVSGCCLTPHSAIFQREQVNFQ